MKRTGSAVLLIAVLLATLTACGDGERARELDAAPGDPVATAASATDDTTRLAQIYDTLNARYGRLMADYRQMAGEMGGDVQQMYDYMEQMHGQATQRHQMMMGGRGGMMGQGGMMGRGRHGGGMMGGGMMERSQTREWDQQMLAMHQQMGQYMRQQGYDQMAGLHDQMARSYGEAADALPEAEGEASEAPPSPEGEVSGANVYRQHCATCHGSSGQGLGGAFPPLAGSDWVTGSAETPVRIVLHGLQGQVEVGGQSYDGMMPAFRARLSDDEVAAVLSYVRSQWGNDAPAISADAVRSVRQQYEGRTQPWSPDAVR